MNSKHKKTFIISFLLLSVNFLCSQDKKDYTAVRTHTAPEIDGRIEKLWQQAPIANDFWMHEPYNHRQPSFETYFQIMYDDQALYVACYMADPHPDSIKSELGQRDDFDNLNADNISLDFFPFNDGLNGYAFKLTPDNLQADEKYSPAGVDRNWDAVWESATAVTDSGWVAEIRIPWSALRFPRKEEQSWGFSIWRHIRRYREWDTWTDMEKGTGNIFAQYGTISGIRNIDPPMRLSIMPYMSAYANMYEKETEYPWNGGMDMKYGINESFTLDMTLIPDFGQVTSDDIVLNLTPFEIQYDEKRQFFTEGTELFSKGDIFYSRRIGGTPRDYARIAAQLDSGEVILENPDRTRLLNATKISGRTSKGLGIGFFNAITANTYATVKVPHEQRRKILTQPFSNYNMVVLDQNLANNSYLALINTNVTMFRNNYSANVTGTDFNLKNKKQTYSISGVALLSQKYSSISLREYGHHYKLKLNKEKGNFVFDIEHKVLSDDYNPNDMGYLARNNYIEESVKLQYRVLNPRWIILNWHTSLMAEYQMLHQPRRYASLYIHGNSRNTFKNHLTMNFYWGFYPEERHDFYEARIRYAVFDRPPQWNAGFWVSSDYSKRLAVDAGSEYEEAAQWDMHQFMFRLSPRFRVNDQVFLTAESRIEKAFNSRGFVDYNSPDIIFGERNSQTITNTISSRYIISVNTGFNLRARHYWARVKYDDYFTLQPGGELQKHPASSNYDINFNAFNVDLSFYWRFAPGSEMSVVWKNELLQQSSRIYDYYRESLEQVFAEPQFNSLSVKILYYLDYDSVAKKLKKRKNVY